MGMAISTVGYSKLLDFSGGGDGKSSLLFVSWLMFKPRTWTSTPSNSTSTDTSWFSRGHLQFAHTFLLDKNAQKKNAELKR